MEMLVHTVAIDLSNTSAQVLDKRQLFQEVQRFDEEKLLFLWKEYEIEIVSNPIVDHT